LDRLISEYPDHGFVIDRKEAGELFERVRPLSKAEAELVSALGQAAKWPLPPDHMWREFLSKPKEKAHDTGDTGAPVPETKIEPTPAPTGEHVQSDGLKVVSAA
jgi:hypothetical protein